MRFDFTLPRIVPLGATILAWIVMVGMMFANAIEHPDPAMWAMASIGLVWAVTSTFFVARFLRSPDGRKSSERTKRAGAYRFERTAIREMIALLGGTSTAQAAARG